MSTHTNKTSNSTNTTNTNNEQLSRLENAVTALTESHTELLQFMKTIIVKTQCKVDSDLDESEIENSDINTDAESETARQAPQTAPPVHRYTTQQIVDMLGEKSAQMRARHAQEDPHRRKKSIRKRWNPVKKWVFFVRMDTWTPGYPKNFGGGAEARKINYEKKLLLVLEWLSKSIHSIHCIHSIHSIHSVQISLKKQQKNALFGIISFFTPKSGLHKLSQSIHAGVHGACSTHACRNLLPSSHHPITPS